jgi:hypothetical protein
MAQARPARRYKFARAPRKSPGQRRQRLKVQRRRLVALGVAEEKIAKLRADEVRDLLRNPTRTVARMVKAKAKAAAKAAAK